MNAMAGPRKTLNRRKLNVQLYNVVIYIIVIYNIVPQQKQNKTIHFQICLALLMKSQPKGYRSYPSDFE